MFKKIVLTFLAILFLIPYFWMGYLSFKPESIVVELIPTFDDMTFENYEYMVNVKYFSKWLLNVLYISVMGVILTCTSASMAGYVLAKKKFPGGQFIFYAMLASMAIPGNTLLIPQYLLMRNLGLINTHTSMFVMCISGVFGIFLMKQAMKTIPNEIIESGQIDGASELQIFWHLIIPMVKPVIVAIGLFTFVGVYGNYYWQMLMSRTESMRTLPLAVEFFKNLRQPKIQLTMAAAMIASLPLIIVFVLFYKYFIGGPTMGAVKG